MKQIESTFDRSEAQVFRDSSEIYIRLVGLSFPSGSADIGDTDYQLLTKVQNAIRIFDDSEVIVEGHTDSHGADDSNLSLSEQRAESVRQYLMAQMGLSYDQVSAVGYGETQPVANNETPQGRARNRRIDVRIVPYPDTGADLAAATFSAGRPDRANGAGWPQPAQLLSAFGSGAFSVRDSYTSRVSCDGAAASCDSRVRQQRL